MGLIRNMRKLAVCFNLAEPVRKRGIWSKSGDWIRKMKWHEASGVRACSEFLRGAIAQKVHVNGKLLSS